MFLFNEYAFEKYLKKKKKFIYIYIYIYIYICIVAVFFLTLCSHIDGKTTLLHGH